MLRIAIIIILRGTKIYAKMGFSLILPIRVIQGVLALAVVGLSASGMEGSLNAALRRQAAQRTFDGKLTNAMSVVVHWYNVTTAVSSPSQLNFLIFGGIWSILSLVSIEVVPRFFPRGKLAPLALLYCPTCS